jgi:threonine synthase
VAAADTLANTFAADTKIVCLATAHAAKFPDVIRKALAMDGELPEQAVHKSIEAAKDLCQHVRLCDCTKLAPALPRAIQSVTKYRAASSKPQPGQAGIEY